MPITLPIESLLFATNEKATKNAGVVNNAFDKKDDKRSSEVINTDGYVVYTLFDVQGFNPPKIGQADLTATKKSIDYEKIIKTAINKFRNYFMIFCGNNSVAADMCAVYFPFDSDNAEYTVDDLKELVDDKKLMSESDFSSKFILFKAGDTNKQCLDKLFAGEKKLTRLPVLVTCRYKLVMKEK